MRATNEGFLPELMPLPLVLAVATLVALALALLAVLSAILLTVRVAIPRTVNVADRGGALGRPWPWSGLLTGHGRCRQCGCKQRGCRQRGTPFD